MNGIAITVDDIDELTAVVDTFRRGERELTGLELYYELERASPLLGFHTMLREGPKNRDANGLQQSYGDHNRLLMLGLDRLVSGDLAWLRTRVDARPAGAGVTDTDLRAVLDAAAGLELSRDALVALWLAAALHDCGMLCGRGAYVDVEDGLVISRDIVEALCPEPLRGLAYFALHHHDYIKDVFLGEVPIAVVAHELMLLDPSLRRTALAALGLVQIAGAASLGTGRLDAFRIAIFRRCIDGTALDDTGHTSRAARLLSSTPEVLVDDPRGAEADTTIDRLDPVTWEALAGFLDATPLHGWHRALDDTLDDTPDRTPRAERLDLLVAIAARARAADADSVVVAVDGRSNNGRDHVETALSGCRLLLTRLVTGLS